MKYKTCEIEIFPPECQLNPELYMKAYTVTIYDNESKTYRELYISSDLTKKQVTKIAKFVVHDIISDKT